MAANLHLEESEIATALRQAGGVKCKAADILGTTPVTISHYMKTFPRLHKVVERAKAERREAAERNRKQKERRWGEGMSSLLNPRQRRFVGLSEAVPEATRARCSAHRRQGGDAILCNNAWWNYNA